MSEDFAGKHVVVLGCGIAYTGLDDIGQAVAEHMAAAGAHVSFAQVNEADAQATVQRIHAAGGSATAYQNDPREVNGVFDLADAILTERPTVDALVTHYFGADFSSVEELSIEDWERTIRVNLTGAFAATKAFLPGLRRGGDPAIVHTSSIDGSLGNVNVPSFSASKAGVNTLVHVLAGELAAQGIRVNAIGRAASTVMPLKENVYQELNRATPLARPADPAEYARAIAFLASPQASYITGAVLAVDGGRTGLTPGCTPSYEGFGAGTRPSNAGYQL